MCQWSHGFGPQRWIPTSPCTSKDFCSSSQRQSGWSAAVRRNNARIILGRFRAQSMDLDDRISGSSMYLPSCTYYVSGADFPGLPHYLSQSQSSHPVTYSYQSSALPQIPSVRDVAFRDYGIDASSKWHHSRGSLSHCYAEDMHRDSWACTRGGEVPVKGGSGHSSSSSATSALGGGSVGRNGVLPQAFDQFFDPAYGSAEGSVPEADRHSRTSPAPAHAGSDSAESCSPKSSSGNSEEKQTSSGSECYDARRKQITRSS